MAGHLVTQEQLGQVHTVLVEPGDSLNIGSVARAMDNFGFSHLHLVAPPRYDAGRAAQTACWATKVLNEARIHSSLEEALAPMTEVIGFSTRSGKNRPPLVDLSTWLQDFRRAPPARLALVFGPEDTGLTQEHVNHCRILVRIPTTSANPALNLAQAALIVLYEVARGGDGRVLVDAAPWSDFQELDRLVETIARRSDFYHSGTPEDLPGVLRNLFRRTRASHREAQIVLGFFGRMIKALEKKS